MRAYSNSISVNAMALGGETAYIDQGMYMHTALPELILRAFGNLK